MRFVVRRLIFYVVTAWAALTINFLIPRLMPGDPVQAFMMRYQGQLSPQAVKALSALLGVDTQQNLIQQYGSYWGRIAQGDLGVSMTYYPTPVTAVIKETLPWTLVLVGFCTVVSFVLGTLLGLIIGWRRGSWADALVPTTTFFSSIPYFWLGLIAVTVIAIWLGWFPISGAYHSGLTVGPNWPFLHSVIIHGVLPAVTIIMSSIAGWILGMRNMTVSVMSDDYVTVAHAKGLPERRVMISYAARNAILPNLASFALALGFVVGGSLLVEVVFNYPGVGYSLLQAVSNEDYPLMQGLFLVISLAVLVANILADVVYFALDPRTREGS